MGQGNGGCRLRISATNPGAIHMTTKQLVSSAVKGERDTCQCECPNMIEVSLRIRACQCKAPKIVGQDERRLNGIADQICECLNRSNSKSNFLKIDFVDGHVSDPEDCPGGVGGEKRRNVMVLKLNELNVKCENGLRHELYFPAASTVGQPLSPGDTVAFSMSSTGDIQEHKPIPVPDDDHQQNGTVNGGDTETLDDKKSSRKPVERQFSKSMDDVKDVKPPRDRPVKSSRSAQNVADKASGKRRGSVAGEDNSMSDMDSIELIIISDEFLNESQQQQVIIVNDQMAPLSKSFQTKKTFLHEQGRTNGRGRSSSGGDYFKRAAEVKAKAEAKRTSATSGKRLVIISDEYKRKSQENSVRIVKSKDRLVPKQTQKALPKSKTISNAMVDLNSKIISCVLQSYEEPERLESKTIEDPVRRDKETVAKQGSYPAVTKVGVKEKLSEQETKSEKQKK